jgi:Recombinase
MAKKERIRETLTGLPTLEYLMRRIELGWRPSAIEWERDILPEGADRDQWSEEIPYGLQVSSDCAGLVENPSEREVITMAIDMIVDDRPLSQVALALNVKGYRTRTGHEWTPSDLFSLLPRMIQVGPKLFTTEQWMTRRQRLPRVV